MDLRGARTAAQLNHASMARLPGWLRIEITDWREGEIRGRPPLRPELLAPHGGCTAEPSSRSSSRPA